MEALLATWLKNVKGGNIDKLTADEIVQLGNMACGLTTSHIAALPEAVYK